MAKAGTVRADGHTASNQVADEQAKDLDKRVEDTFTDSDNGLWFSAFGLSRVRTDWRGQDRVALNQVKHAIDERIGEEFADAWAIMFDLWSIVRAQAVDHQTGEFLTDDQGFPVWQRSPTGAYYEDWSRLSERQKEDFLFRITAQIFEWQQRAADIWTEAMFSKAQWTERFAHAFDGPISGTVDDRTAVANKASAEDRYFALYVSAMSRKADALVKSMDSLALRLRDVLRA